MSEDARTHAPRPHRPVQFPPSSFEEYAGGADPARISEAAHLAAQALVRHGRASDDPDVTSRLVQLADEQGLEAVAELWAASPPRSLPGSLWRLYALRASAQANPERISVYFAAGKNAAEVSNVVAGVAEPPGADEVRQMTDTILSGAFEGDYDVALERSAAFCRVVALGQTDIADETDATDGIDAADHRSAEQLTNNAHLLVKTAEDLEAAAWYWRRGELD